MNTLELQRTLHALGFDPGAIDGFPGRNTTAAVRAFQQAARLTVDGIVGKDTLAALEVARQLGRVVLAAQTTPESTTYPMLPWMELAVKNIGVAEVVGPKHSATIMGWLAQLGTKRLGTKVTDDETPWCGTFAAMCLATTLPNEPLPPIVVRAASFDAFGVPVQPTRGAILRFQRPGGGHVGFHDGEDATHFHVLGGNQSNRVSVMRLEKSRMVACRWPSTVPVPKVPDRRPSPRVGGISRNEG
ncbi:baseplate hub subunit and tail lysozyme [Caulobacter phage W2]|uniref:Baseplate hub subunit and tail lysozyme n=1 Tax=Caulobacter phage TMCBR4 TaxID=3028191 RepID=A0AAE9ZPV2_9CAUD|nr:baseplate hub subunit and tail lysozyme [Caulobacter phage TMCBR4]WDS38392.1 baseplate hub subunit and tail lysozyme [Caulobacter phage W2]